MLQSGIILLIVGLIYIVFQYFSNAQGRDLANKFKSLGNMKGMTKQEIVNIAGAYKTITYIEGGSVCIWAAQKYGISLVFDKDDKVIKIDTEVVL